MRLNFARVFLLPRPDPTRPALFSTIFVIFKEQWRNNGESAKWFLKKL